ncbi:PD-(D/E)XK nuclease family protein [Nonomuraea sp. NPDC050547]|uniref:PD-(D/E)XK nuclease family protein n=1 Tax=Nonomuraea sp. NPDC050547 TaxID=3364368 RepID=UPI0037941E9E
MAEKWPPDGMYRRTDVVSIRLSMFGPERYRCPAADALQAHGFAPRRRAAEKPEKLEQFPHGPFMAALDQAERPADEPRNQRRSHDGVRQWTRHALEMYGKAFPPALELRPARRPWVYRYRRGDGAKYQISAWGRCFESSDGRQRELRLPTNRVRPRTKVERAVAALITAEADPDPRLERVRVVQFSLSDGQVDTIFDGTREEALSAYRTDGAPAVRALLDNRGYQPGSACGTCAVSPVCPALPAAPGLLGIADRTRPRRSWSPTTGNGYKKCPARAHMRGLRLPVNDAVERSADAERGRAVHAFLAAQHCRRPSVPCGSDIPPDWMPEGFDLPVEEQRLGAELLRHHAEVCPIRLSVSESEIRIEPALAFDDSAADLLVLTDPDLLYQDGDARVWRETKTSRWNRPCRDVLTRYPQVALAVRIIGAGLLSGPDLRGRVELELLQPAGVDLHLIDPFAAGVQSAAETALREQVSGWHADGAFNALPGPECKTCEVSRWCSKRATEAAP